MHPLLHRTTIFAEGLDHPECVAVHPDGTVWAGGEAGQIYRISEDGSHVEEVANTGGFILGIAFSPGAEWLAICDLGKHCLWKLDLKSYSLSLFAEKVPGHRFNIPNYAVFDKQGNLYCTESGEFREIKGKILKFKANGEGEIWHPGPINFANGMAMGINEEALYVVSSWLPGVERIEIKADGSAGERSVYCTLPETIPDGVVFDQQGNLYTSCYAPNKIFKIDTRQTVSLLIEDWEAHTLSNPTNMAFGGKDFSHLFVSNLGRWHITKIDLGVEGHILPSHLRDS